jgi:acyl-CoA reductase-like NAD-dependent aldehyde dehydrogenase
MFFRVKDEDEAMALANDPGAELPSGGIKDSGYGRGRKPKGGGSPSRGRK